MKNIGTVTELKEAIRLLEIEQAEKAILLKDQFHLVYENLNPLYLARNFLRDITSSRYTINDIFDNTVAVIAGYFSKKIILGKSANSFQKLTGSVLQFGVTKLVSQFKEQIRSFTYSFIQSIFSKEEKEVS
jgi:hypothetical protein